MYGLIFTELKKYAFESFKGDRWRELLKEAGIARRAYLNIKNYPDEEAAALIATAAQRLGKDPSQFLEGFGEFMAPRLVRLYAPMIAPEWKTLDLIEHTEASIHELIRRGDDGGRPPPLQCSRPSAGEVVISYSSPRKMCGFAKGIARGLAKHFGERIVLTEGSCMHNGDPRCTISVRLDAPSAA